MEEKLKAGDAMYVAGLISLWLRILRAFRRIIITGKFDAELSFDNLSPCFVEFATMVKVVIIVTQAIEMLEYPPLKYFHPLFIERFAGHITLHLRQGRCPCTAARLQPFPHVGKLGH